MPPVAIAGFSNGAIAIDPSGAAMTVFAPLSTTTWRHSAAAASGRLHARLVVGGEVAVLRGVVAAPRAKPRELARVGRQDAGPLHAVPPAVRRRERAQRLGVEHDGAPATPPRAR